MATIEITPFLRLMAEHHASDLFFSVGAPPSIKIQGVTRHVGDKVLSPEALRDLAYAAMNDKQQREFEAQLEMNLAIALPGTGRFRLSIYRQRGSIAVAVRYITSQIPSLEALHLPPVLNELILLPRGLILVVGATGSGKSSTLAAMIDHRNRNRTRTGHILTVEDPIEFLHEHKQSVVDQREIGIDTLSYAAALKNAMRQAPEVIMIGEIRDRETMAAAIAYAETGHLCLSTLHANNANQTLDRIINFFPETARHQLLIDLSLNLKAVISQRLVRAVDGTRVPAVEILMSSPFIADLIEKGEIASIKEAMKASKENGMQTFDGALYDLYAAGRISYEQAIENADSRTDLALRIRLEGGPASHELDGMSIAGLDSRR
jgi:twitching motility protein PilU